jgi:hypothetical protein
MLNMPVGSFSSGAWSVEGGDALRHGALRRLFGQDEVMAPRCISDGNGLLLPLLVNF